MRILSLRSSESERQKNKILTSSFMFLLAPRKSFFIFSFLGKKWTTCSNEFRKKSNHLLHFILKKQEMIHVINFSPPKLL